MRINADGKTKKEKKIMASAKQIAWRKKFARMSKAGVFRSTKKGKARAKSSGSPEVQAQTAQHLGGIRRSRELTKIEALEEQKYSHGTEKITWIPDEVMVKATEAGWKLPSTWFNATRKQKLGFLKKFWRTQ